MIKKISKMFNFSKSLKFIIVLKKKTNIDSEGTFLQF